MEVNPLVSIITPSYNQAKFIKYTIDSVLQQDYDNIEYIVIDACSIDGTIDILKEYGDKIKWISEKDEGQSDAINKGFKMCKGEIIAWLNADDTYNASAISAIVPYFVANSELGLLYGKGNVINENNDIVSEFVSFQKFDLWTLVNALDYILQPTTFMRKSCVENVNFLNKDLHWCMDWDLWIKLAKISKVVAIESVLANTREYADTKTSTGSWKRQDEINFILRTYSGKYNPVGCSLYKTTTIYTEIMRNPLLGQRKWIVNRATKWHTDRGTGIYSTLPLIFRDGWVGPEVRLLVPDKYPNVSISFFVVNHKVLPLGLEVKQGGKTIYRNTFSQPQDYKVEFSAQTRLSMSGLNEFVLYFDKHFSYIGTGDKRRLSVMVNVVEYH